MLSEHWKKLALAAFAVAALVPALVNAGAPATQPYAVAVAGGYEVVPLLSVGDAVPETSNPGQQYRMVGIPDGLGITKERFDRFSLFMNHEFTNTTMSEPVAGQPQSRGAFVSKYILDKEGNVLSGERAYDTVYAENTLVGPAAQEGNETPGFGRFCSSSVAGYGAGLDRTIYFTNEEADAASSFDGRGGQTVAVFDNEAHTLPKLGRFSKENTLVMPYPGRRTVIISLEDGPSGPDSQLYMYVGWKNYRAGGTALGRNGLDNGTLYTFVSDVAGKTNEATFQRGTIHGHWLPIPGAESMTADELEAASDALGAFGFVRIEDGSFADRRPGDFFFVTTGGNADAGNELGRLYHLKLNLSDPTRTSQLEVVYNADTIVDGVGDIALSPDNLDVSGRYLMINEDGTTQSRAVMTSKGRDGAIWRFDIDNNASGAGVDASSATMVAELNPPGRDGAAVGAGVWESSGIIDTGGFFGPDSWIFDVQAHAPTVAPVAGTVEDGQLLLMRPRKPIY